MGPPPSRGLSQRGCDVAPSLLFGQTGAAGANQPGVGRLEAPERAAVGRQRKDLFVVLAAKSEVGRRQIAARRRYRDKPNDDAARVDLHDPSVARINSLARAVDVGAATAAHLVGRGTTPRSRMMGSATGMGYWHEDKKLAAVGTRSTAQVDQPVPNPKG